MRPFSAVVIVTCLLPLCQAAQVINQVLKMEGKGKVRGSTTTPPPATTTVGCPDNFVKIGNSCYYFGNVDKYQPEALSECEALGADLISIETAAEDEALEEYFESLENHYWYWISLYKSGGVWRWYGETSGPAATYTNFYSDEGTISGRIYAEFKYGRGWYSSPPNWDQYYACCEIRLD